MIVFAEDLTGRRFGRVTVLEKAGVTSYRAAIWRCRCDCGTVFEAFGSNLKAGRTKSCGCLRAEMNRSRIVIVEK